MPETENTPLVSQAFVLGAGLGTRLKQLTRALPKPLVPVAGRPLITRAFDHLLEAGVQRLVVNTHHCAEAYASAFPGGHYRDALLTFRHEPVLLETGGGIKNVEDLLHGAPFIIYNGDILSTLPLRPAIARHFAAGNEVTLVLRSHGGPLQVAFDPGTGRILDIGQRLGRAPGTHLFTGIYVVNPEFFARLRLEKVSVIPAFLEMITQGAKLGAIVVDEGDWWDLGTREQYLEVHRVLRAADPHACWVDPSAQIDPSAQLTGATYVGPNVKVGAHAILHDCILWNGTRIAPHSALTRCIVTANQTIGGEHTDADFQSPFPLMIPDSLLDQTAARFPKFFRDRIRIEPLEKGGSDRKYYRVAMCGEGSLILVKYGSQREENRHYCDIAAFLDSLDVRVPAIYHHDTAEGLIWMEDLGGADLWQFRNEPWPVRQTLYRSALEQIVRLHTRGHLAAGTSLPRFEIAFDADLYRWEQNYFFENCAGRYFGIAPAAIDAGCERDRFQEIAEKLGALPRVLVHRDFQSQNIMILENRACLIDFQGMRPGLAPYDLASLLYDPYVSLSGPERASLLADAVALYAEAGAPVADDFKELFDYCALQRLMQALGAYGFLGLVKHHPHFLGHIPPALASLREVAGRIPGLTGFCDLLGNMESGAVKLR